MNGPGSAPRPAMENMMKEWRCSVRNQSHGCGQFLTSKTDDYENWKTRRILGIQPEGSSDWFFTVHMGWWNDEEEPFVDQVGMHTGDIERFQNTGKELSG